MADRLDTSVNQRFSSRLGVLLSCVGIAIGTGYLFTPQWSQLAQPKIWMEALTQNAWDTGAGWGLFLTYATYMKQNQGVAKNAFSTGIANNTISLIAAMMVFGIVFSVLGAEKSKVEILNLMRDSGEAGTGLDDLRRLHGVCPDSVRPPTTQDRGDHQ